MEFEETPRKHSTPYIEFVGANDGGDNDSESSHGRTGSGRGRGPNIQANAAKTLH